MNLHFQYTTIFIMLTLEKMFNQLLDGTWQKVQDFKGLKDIQTFIDEGILDPNKKEQWNEGYGDMGLMLNIAVSQDNKNKVFFSRYPNPEDHQKIWLYSGNLDSVRIGIHAIDDLYVSGTPWDFIFITYT